MATSKLTIALTGDMAAVVCNAVESGEFPTHEAVVQAALEEWNSNRVQIDVAHLKRCWDEAMLSDETVSVDVDEMFARLRAKHGLSAGDAVAP